MGTLSTTYPPRHAVRSLRSALSTGVRCCLLAAAILPACGQTVAPPVAQATSSLSVPLLLPTAVAFDAQGNLYFAETNRQAIRRVDTSGTLTTVAGDGTQGFSGDGGPAVAAQLDSPTGLALDTSGNLYIADAHNHRIRRVDAATGTIATVAGNGTAGFSGDGGKATLASLNLPAALALDASGNLLIADGNNHRIRKVTAATGTIATVAGSGLQGFAGDGGLATAAALDSPSGLAVDAAGNLYLADSRNHRVRVVRAATGLIATVAGTGTAGFSGDNATASSAALALPHGVSVDTAGNILIADTNNQRIRRISPQGTMTTVAGDGTQGFAGDGGPAIAASLDTPRGVALSPASLVTLADTGNQRIRQVAANATIATVAGLGAPAAEMLSLNVASSSVYGTGSMTATLTSSTLATGSIAFVDNGALGAVGSAALTSDSATLSTASLAAGVHRLYASYTGDLLHAAAQSATMMLTVTPAPLTAIANSANILYGQAVPLLSGTLSGVLPQDAGKVTLALASAAATLSVPGSYPIAGSLSGSAAGNYVLAPLLGAAVTIARAPSVVTLSIPAQSIATGQPLGLTLHVASTTSGTPTGNVMLLDGGNPLATLPLSGTGDAAYSASALAVGTHVLTAMYPGDGNFTPSSTVGQSVSIANPTTVDFTLAATGSTSETVAAGSAAGFNFAVQMQGGTLSSPITLAASSLPAGTTASFSPNYLPPGGAVTAFTLTIQTPKAAVKTSALPWTGAAAFGLLLLPWGTFALRGRRLLAGCCCLLLLVGATGCGAHAIAVASASSSTNSYPITVSGTATSTTGAPLVHTATVILTVQ